MTRFFYCCLLRMHPRHFRRRFGEEMLWIFDQAAAHRHSAPLFADAIFSLWRQWALRPEFRVTPRPALDGLPVFYTGPSEAPRPSALVHGALLSVFIFGAICYVLSHSNSHGSLALQMGSHNHSFSHFLETHTISAAPTDLTTELKVKPEPKARRASAYFSLMPVLTVLDADNDGVVSASEIARAPALLLTLDANHENRLTAEECGLHVQHPTQTMRREFMLFHPVLAALDANHDGEISANEILNAPAALMALDKNRDGQLTEDELLPDEIVNDRILNRARQRKQ